LCLCNVAPGAKGGAAGAIPAKPAAGLVGKVAGMAMGFTLARLVAGIWGVCRRRASAAGPDGGGRGRRQCRRCSGGGAGLGGGEVHGISREVWRWLCGSRVTRKGELRVRPTMAGRRCSDGHAGAGACGFIHGRAKRFAQHHFTDTSMAWARHGGVRARSTVATPLGGRCTVGSVCPRCA
jgi:hypothetical protein